MVMPPAPQPIDGRALEELDALVARAFGIEGGYLELNGIVSAPGAAGYNMFEDLGLFGSPMRLVIPALRKDLQARGGDIECTCLEALFVALPGNFELRNWIALYCPTMLAQVSETTFTARRAAYEMDRMERRVRSMGTSLTTLGPNIQLLPAQKALGDRMLRKLDELGDYKAIHDTLHGLQGKTLFELGRLSGEQILGIERRQSLSVQAQDLRGAGEQMARRFSGPQAPEAAREARALAVSAIESIVTLLEASPPEARETPEAVAGLLRAVLRQQMGLFDSKLVATVDEIPFTDFADMLRSLPQPAGSPTTGPAGDPVLAANIGASFQDIEARLVRRRTVHTLWQQVEATLLNVEELLRGTGREIELRFHWQNLSDLVERISDLSAEHGLFALSEPGQPGAAPADFAAQVRSEGYRAMFEFFAREARARFQRADNAMLSDCELLKQLQQPLHILVGD